MFGMEDKKENIRSNYIKQILIVSSQKTKQNQNQSIAKLKLVFQIVHAAGKTRSCISKSLPPFDDELSVYDN